MNAISTVGDVVTVVLVLIGSFLCLTAGLARDPTLVPVLVVVSLLAFVGSVSVASYVGGMLLRSAGDGQDVGLSEAPEERAARPSEGDR